METAVFVERGKGARVEDDCRPEPLSSATRTGACGSALTKRFSRNHSGASAVEFAIVASLFFSIVIGTLELGLLFMTSSSVNLATAAMTKKLRTGQVQAAGLSTTNVSGPQLTLANATAQICSQVHGVSNAHCLQQLQIDIRPISSFQNVVTSLPVTGKTFNSSSLCYYSGNAGDIVEVRVFFLYSFITPVLSWLSNISTYTSSSGTSSGRYFLIKSAQVYKTENFSGNANTGAGC